MSSDEAQQKDQDIVDVSTAASDTAEESTAETSETTQSETEDVQNDKPESTEDDSEQSEKTQAEITPEPTVTPALATEGGREVSHKILYIGGLTKSVTEENLTEIFSASGSVHSVKILFDKNRPGFNYAFVEFDDEQSASAAYESMNGNIINGSEIKINWAYQSQQAKSNPDAFNVFVGDLSPEVDDEKLKKTFSKFASLLQAHVMWDMQSGRSRAYGFVSFQDQKDADEAIKTMNGLVLYGRAIRLNWASHKQQVHGGHGNSSHHHHNGNHHHHNGSNHYYKYNNNNGPNHHHHHHNTHNAGSYNNYAPPMLPNGQGGSPVPTVAQLGAGQMGMQGSGSSMMSPPSYEAVLRKSPSWQTTVYLGNLAHFTTQNDLIPLLQNFGFIVDLKFYPEKSCAFVKYDSHERAALAIVQLTGLIVNGRPLKLGWGREKTQPPPPQVGYQNYGPIGYAQ